MKSRVSHIGIALLEKKVIVKAYILLFQILTRATISDHINMYIKMGCIFPLIIFFLRTQKSSLIFVKIIRNFKMFFNSHKKEIKRHEH